MLSFENDYSEGAHIQILQRLLETNMEKVSGYGNDKYCESAKERLKKPVNVTMRISFFWLAEHRPMQPSLLEC